MRQGPVAAADDPHAVPFFLILVFLTLVFLLPVMQLVTRFLAFAAVGAPFLAQAAPFCPAPAPPSDYIPGKYMILLKPDCDSATIDVHHNKARAIRARSLARRATPDDGAAVERIYNFGNFKGYAGSFDETDIEKLKALPEVSSISLSIMIQQFSNKSSGFVR